MDEGIPDLVVLDVMLPGTDSIERWTPSEARRRSSELAIRLWVGQGGCRSFEMVAVDYVVKSFSMTELAARIRVALGRRRPLPGFDTVWEPYALQELTTDYGRREVALGDEPVELTDMEHRSSVRLSVHAGWVATHEHLLDQLLGSD